MKLRETEHIVLETLPENMDSLQKITWCLEEKEQLWKDEKSKLHAHIDKLEKELVGRVARIQELEEERKAAFCTSTTQESKNDTIKNDLSVSFYEKLLEPLWERFDDNEAELLNKEFREWFKENDTIAMEIASRLNELQGEVFRVAIEKGERLDEARTALTFIDEQMDLMEEYGLFGDSCVFAVQNTKGDSVYENYLTRIQVKLWRATALKAILKKDQDTVDAIVKMFNEGLLLVEKEDDGANEETDEWFADDAGMEAALKIFNGLVNV